MVRPPACNGWCLKNNISPLASGGVGARKPTCGLGRLRCNSPRTRLATAADACPKNDASGIRPAFVCRANFFGVMHYEGVEYVVRASLGRDEWTLLIYFPDKTPD